MSPPAWNKRDNILALGLFCAALIPRVLLVPVTYLNMHAARDMYRSLALLGFGSDAPPLAGPELFFGGRIPGFFYYALNAVPLAIWQSPWSVALWIAFLGAAGAGITYLAVRLVAGRPAALAAGLIYAFYPLTIIEGLYLWNPSYIAFLCSLGVLCFAWWLRSCRGLAWALMVTCALLAMQVHLSAYTILVAAITTVLAMAARRPFVRGREPDDPRFRGVRFFHWLLPLALVLPFVFPYLWEDGWELFVPLRLPEQGAADVGILSFEINETALDTLGKSVMFSDDYGSWQGFSHFALFFLALKEMSPILYGLTRTLGQALAIVCFVAFFLPGVAAALMTAIGPSGAFRGRLLQTISFRADAARPFMLGILVWIVVPAFFLLKMTKALPDERDYGIPTRYVVIFYPVVMILSGFGFSLWWNASVARRVSRFFAVTLLAATISTHFLVICSYVWVASVTGEVTFYTTEGKQVSKPLFIESELSRFLAKYELTREDMLERFLTGGHFSEAHTEEYLDYPLFTGLREMDGADPSLWFYLYDTTRAEEPPPLILASGTVIDEFRVRQFHLLVIRRPDPEEPIVWPQAQLEPIGVR